MTRLYKEVMMTFLILFLPVTFGAKLDHLQTLDSLLKKDYDRRATPTNHFNNATTVVCELYIRSFGSISPVNMGELPYLAVLYKSQDKKNTHVNATSGRACGGALVSTNKVLTLCACIRFFYCTHIKFDSDECFHRPTASDIVAEVIYVTFWPPDAEFIADEYYVLDTVPDNFMKKSTCYDDIQSVAENKKLPNIWRASIVIMMFSPSITDLGPAEIIPLSQADLGAEPFIFLFGMSKLNQQEQIVDDEGYLYDPSEHAVDYEADYLTADCPFSENCKNQVFKETVPNEYKKTMRCLCTKIEHAVQLCKGVPGFPVITTGMRLMGVMSVPIDCKTGAVMVYLFDEGTVTEILDYVAENPDESLTTTAETKMELETTKQKRNHTTPPRTFIPDHGEPDYEVDLYLRQKWHDERLQHPDITEVLDLNDPNLVKAIWKPEVYFPNAKHAEFQFVTVPNVLIRIYPDGEILYMLRLKLTFSCMMDLSSFPLDTQVCTMEVASFSKTTEELRLEWKTFKPVIMGKGLKMPQFEIDKISASDCQETFQIGNYSCLVAEFYLSRSVGFHLVQSYLPTILIVVISWVSFWMDVDSVPGRTTLGVTTLLAVSSQSAGIQSGLPQVSYVKAIDVWMGTCTAFVFCALLEFTFVNYKWRKFTKPSSIVQQPHRVNGEISTFDIQNDQVSPKGLVFEKKDPKHATLARKIDEYARFGFPALFAVFNVFYWSYYLI